MGTNQSSEVKKTEEKDGTQTTPATHKVKRLTYQESFDIRSKQLNYSNKNNRDDRNSISSTSESELHSGYSSSSRKKVKRNKSNIRPPLLLYTNQLKKMECKQKREIFCRKKSQSSASETSQKDAQRPKIRIMVKNDEVKLVVATNQSFKSTNQRPTSKAETSSFDNTDIEEEIDLILNDHAGNVKPWYRDPKLSESSSTVSPVKSDKKDSSNEEIYSAKSLPTPSFYLYLTFDEDMKKSKSIEVLDAPNYFFLNYDEDTQIPTDSPTTSNINETEIP